MVIGITALTVLIAVAVLGLASLHRMETLQRRVACYERLTMEMTAVPYEFRDHAHARELSTGMARTCSANPNYGLPPT